MMPIKETLFFVSLLGYRLYSKGSVEPENYRDVMEILSICIALDTICIELDTKYKKFSDLCPQASTTGQRSEERL